MVSAIVKIIAIIVCLVLALVALGSVVIAAPFGLILKVLLFVLAIVGILYVSGLLKGEA